MAISFDRIPFGMDAIRRDLQLDDVDSGPRKTAAGTLQVGSAAEAKHVSSPAAAGGIVVDISDEARRKAEEFGQSFTSSAGKVEKQEEDKTSVEQAIDRTKERIEALKKEIRELEQKMMPDELKEEMLQTKRSELAQLQQQLTELLGKLSESSGSGSDGGGTRAQGAIQSVRPS